MQKDVHFYLTYLLAIKAGVIPEVAKKIAWANQYTDDDLTEAELYGNRTLFDVYNNLIYFIIFLLFLAAG